MNRDDPMELLFRIDSYVENLFATPDSALEAALRRSSESGLPKINVSPNQGRLLRLLAEIAGARRILEIGTLGGYSTIHLARALPEEGGMISLELSETRVEVARENITEAGLGEKVEVRAGDAKALLAEMVEEEIEPFDLTFIDADKEEYPEYLEWAIRLARPGSLILADNTIRGGGVIEPEDKSARVIHKFNESLANDPRLSALILPLIRGRVDGLAIARVL